jgi:hypothetical protein
VNEHGALQDRFYKPYELLLVSQIEKYKQPEPLEQEETHEQVHEKTQAKKKHDKSPQG